MRYFYAKDLVDRGVIAIKYLPSPIMRADILTKPHVGSSLYKLSQLILNSTVTTITMSDLLEFLTRYA